MKKTSVLLMLGLQFTLQGCGSSDEGGGASGGDFAFSGRLASMSTTAAVRLPNATSRAVSEKTITHVMAISPESANPERFVSTISADGAFSLNVDSGKPYVFVFIAGAQDYTGPDMIAGVVRVPANGLDTLAPVAAGASDLGTVTVDGTAQSATVSTSVSDLLGTLGITAAEATFLGTIDDLSLRSANPDVDGNGVIDSLEGKSFNMDWHVRADMNVAVGGARAKFSDVVNKYLSSPELNFSLSSGYAVYPTSFASGTCPSASGMSTALAAGCSFDIKNLAGTASVLSSWTNNSFSGGSFGGGDSTQWGPDYSAAASPIQEMPGSDGTGVQMVYGLPGGKTLTFWNVKTRSRASLTADGTVIPFLKLNTSDNTATGTMTSIDYKWMKISGGAWTQATAAEVALIVNENGGFAAFYTKKASGTEEGFSFTIPRSSPTGTIAWDSGIRATGATAVLATATPNTFCSSAVSYDDKLGLRIFAGSFEANTGVTQCN